MLVLTGSSAITPTRRAALLKALQGASAGITSVDAVHLHLVNPTSEQAAKDLASGAERDILDRLLAYGDDERLESTAAYLAGKKDGLTAVYVLPRAGTISPWSSKATDIAKLCRLGDHVNRIERGALYLLGSAEPVDLAKLESQLHLIHDRMTQVVSTGLPPATDIFPPGSPQPDPLVTVPIIGAADPKAVLEEANVRLGLALYDTEIPYLVDSFLAAGRNPTDAELFMFAQVNSEHCRHKIFNAAWNIDGADKENSLFGMIRNTEKQCNSNGTLSAYHDNAAILEGFSAPRFAVADSKGTYAAKDEPMPILIKVETHNHPTAVSPYPGAATGSGGEIRDEGATGRGSRPKAGLAGFTVSDLLIPGFQQPWESDIGRPGHIASALDIMIEAPLGAAAFNNEFGRPALGGYFRTFLMEVPSADGSPEWRGYHKPIMIAGGLGTVRPEYALKEKITPGAKVIVLGGPGMLIGLGGGAASSMASGASSADLDFASVQRENPEMQRRCQQVIDACVNRPASEGGNPIQSIHDVGAGGLSNALPELVHDAGLGAVFEIRDVLVDDPKMSPMEIWCNESQERYVLAVAPENLPVFEEMCRRERCPFAVVGTATEEQRLVVTDRLLGENAIDIDMGVLFGKPPRMHRKAETVHPKRTAFDATLKSYSPNATLAEAADRVLHLPSVGSKGFLITIGDRSISGLVTRDQMVGPWQVPVADVAVTRSSFGFDVKVGEAMAMGERTPLALLSAGASARMAVAEALTNLVAASVPDLGKVKLSANWMSAASAAGEGSRLYEAVQAIGMELCPQLGVGIPVGKDSMSMSMRWGDKSVTAPLSLIVTAFSPTDNVTATWTPQLRTDVGETVLVFADIARGKQRLGGSALAQAYKALGAEAPDVEDAAELKAFLNAVSALHKTETVLAYHDRSDGGLFTAVVEMAFAGRSGVELTLDGYSTGDAAAALFNEELGAVFQVKAAELEAFTSAFTAAGFPTQRLHALGRVHGRADQRITVLQGGAEVFSSTRGKLQQAWAETSYKMQSIRDAPLGAKEEFDAILRDGDAGMRYDVKFPFLTSPPLGDRKGAPRVAILREQGVNGHIEMAWAFYAAGFEAVDVHMSDIISGRVSLKDFAGLAACGGFSYGDVLGAGRGWANSVLLNPVARGEFEAFFAREDTFALGVCNGCQFFAQLRDLIPGVQAWPEFKTNRSERFEARVCSVLITEDAARNVLLKDMAGSTLPVAVAHGEGRAAFDAKGNLDQLEKEGLVPVRYVDSEGKVTQEYPLNPNDSPHGISAVQSPSGRVLAIMPHPERVVAAESNSWYPPELRDAWKGKGPWFRLFQNAYEFAASKAPAKA